MMPGHAPLLAVIGDKSQREGDWVVFVIEVFIVLGGTCRTWLV